MLTLSFNNQLKIFVCDKIKAEILMGNKIVKNFDVFFLEKTLKIIFSYILSKWETFYFENILRLNWLEETTKMG